MAVYYPTYASPRTALKDKTVLTIAHRQESRANYDRIIEMQNGRVEAILKL